MAWNEKSKPIEAQGTGYQWSQTIDDVNISVPIPREIGAKQMDIVIKRDSIKVAIKGKPAILEGSLFSTIKPDDSTWTIETDDTGKVVFIVLQKQEQHTSWLSVVKGKDQIDPFLKDQMDRRMMLEKFQAETPGFDFSGAEFSGNLPADPANFMRKD